MILKFALLRFDQQPPESGICRTFCYYFISLIPHFITDEISKDCFRLEDDTWESKVSR
jgi:hypothetical protein